MSTSTPISIRFSDIVTKKADQGMKVAVQPPWYKLMGVLMTYYFNHGLPDSLFKVQNIIDLVILNYVIPSTNH